MKKIAFVVSSLTGGGAERVVINLCEFFNEKCKNEVQCDLIVLNNTGDYIYHGPMQIINKEYSEKNIVKKVYYHFIGYRWKLLQIKKKNRYDQVISFATLANKINIQTHHTEDTIVSVRNYLSLNLNAKQKKDVMHLYKKADKIIAVSQACKEDLVQHFQLNAEKIQVIYNPYQIVKINKAKEASIGPDNHYFQKDKTIIAVGRISRQKAFWRIIKAMAVLKDKDPEIRLIILGKELDGQSMTTKLNHLIDNYQLHEQVHLLGFKANPYAYISRADVYVLSSLYEGFPNGMTEAMIIGKPIISVNCLSGPSEILQEGQYGVLIPQYDQDEFTDDITEGDRKLAQSIEKLFKDSELRSYYESQSLHRGNDFSIDSIASQWLELEV